MAGVTTIPGTATDVASPLVMMVVASPAPKDITRSRGDLQAFFAANAMTVSSRWAADVLFSSRRAQRTLPRGVPGRT
jgi:hypothetical protein